ncbi:MAG TPA: hypothetical protein VEU77_11005 [Candidatus Acidoferrales bacterium]|nr:hypothetical protein [Candidatus Acidoferrales bacterium]
MKCAICQREDLALTREHVFARWLTQRVGSAGPRRAIATVCGECNAGWMSTLEQSFRRAAFTRPRTGPIPAPDRATIARWSIKTALLLADANGVTLVEPAVRSALQRVVPDGFEVFIARRRRSPAKLDYDVDSERDLVRSVAVHVDDVTLTVAPTGALTSRAGTRLWPIRRQLLRWDTLPVLDAAT